MTWIIPSAEIDDMKRPAFLFIALLASLSVQANNKTDCDCPTNLQEVPPHVLRESAEWVNETGVLWGVRTNYCYQAADQYFFATPTKISMGLIPQVEGIYEVTPFVHFEFPEEKVLDYDDTLRILGDSIREKYEGSIYPGTRGEWKFCGRLEKGELVFGDLPAEVLDADGGDACGCQSLEDDSWLPSWLNVQSGSPRFHAWGLRADCNPGMWQFFAFASDGLVYMHSPTKEEEDQRTRAVLINAPSGSSVESAIQFLSTKPPDSKWVVCGGYDDLGRPSLGKR